MRYFIIAALCIAVFMLALCSKDKDTGTNTSGTPLDTTANIDTNGTDTSGADTSGTDTSGVDTSGTDTSGVDTSGTDTLHTDTLATCTVHGTILTAADTLHLTTVPLANITVFNANTNQAVTTTVSDSLGRYTLLVKPGVYYLTIDALGYFPSPSPLGAPLPFQVGDSEYVTMYLEIEPDSEAVNYGVMSGTVAAGDSGTNGVLVIAIRQSDSLSLSSATGPDGSYTIFNVPPGTYLVRSYLAGFECTDSIIVDVAEQQQVEGLDFAITPFTRTKLVGHLTFRAIINGIVDVTLVHPVTLEAVPGLQTFSELNGQTYELTDIPPGTYISWASYRNDGYVVDPDYVFKFGLPVLTFTETDTFFQADYSLTDAITIISPTNAPDSIYPVAISTTTPTFIWETYPSTKEYIVVVYDRSGKRVWGGFDAAGTVLHPQTDPKDTSCVFNFDGSALAPLKRGQIYRWKVFADNDANLNVQTLISSSEDLLGLFYIPEIAE